MLSNDGNVIAVEAYYKQGEAPAADEPDDFGGVVAILHDSAGNIIESGDEEGAGAGSAAGAGAGAGAGWLAFDATPAFAPDFGSDGCGAGTGSYWQPHENIDMRLYPSGWRNKGAYNICIQ